MMQKPVERPDVIITEMIKAHEVSGKDREKSHRANYFRINFGDKLINLAPAGARLT
jgi:hypothetical protein